ncbi:MAG: B12-binding domain-containing radical SAM protein, partial [Proteobacteria bacterium]|nr:B12-binding domain-containing radical SAM protein [Pseudomonadota bacterium]
MRFVLLSPNPPECTALGPRQLASVLRQKGIDCSIVFLRGSIGRHRFDGSFVYQYPQRLLTEILHVCRDADAVGVSVMSPYFDRAAQLTRAVKTHLGKPVIWGGVHATARPVQSLDIADFVCVGDGEISLVEWLNRLVDGDDLHSVRGIWSREGQQIIDTGTAPIVDDLDSLPWPDMDTDGHFVDQ